MTVLGIGGFVTILPFILIPAGLLISFVTAILISVVEMLVRFFKPDYYIG